MPTNDVITPILTGAGLTLKSKDGADFNWTNTSNVRIPSGSPVPVVGSGTNEGFVGVALHAINPGDFGTVASTGQFDFLDFVASGGIPAEFTMGDIVYYDWDELVNNGYLKLMKQSDVVADTSESSVIRVLGICTEDTKDAKYDFSGFDGIVKSTKILLKPYTPTTIAGIGSQQMTGPKISLLLYELGGDTEVTDIASLKTKLQTYFGNGYSANASEAVEKGE